MGPVCWGVMRRWSEVAIRAGKAFGADKCSLLAAGITYFTLVALFPLILFALSVAGFVLTDAGDRQELVDAILEQVPLEGSGEDDLRSIIDSVISARGALGVIGLVGAAWTGSSLFTAVRNSLNVVFEVEKPRNFVLGKGIDLAWVLGVGLLLLLSVGATVAITMVQRFAVDIVGADAATPIRLLLGLANVLVPTVISFGVFFVLYAYVAHSPIPWRHVMPGAVVASVGFEVLKVGFSWYVANFGNYNATYGTLGFIIALLFFINLSSQLMLFGAEFGRANHGVLRGKAATEEYQWEVDHLLGVVRGVMAKVPIVGGGGQETESVQTTTKEVVMSNDMSGTLDEGRDDGGTLETGATGVGRMASGPGEAFGDVLEADRLAAAGVAESPRTAGQTGGVGAGRFVVGAVIVAVWVAVIAGVGAVLSRSRG